MHTRTHACTHTHTQTPSLTFHFSYPSSQQLHCTSGSSLSVIAGVPLVMAVCVSSGVTILYTLVGNMVAVAYTDVLQLALISAGLVGCGSNAEMVQHNHW